MAQTKKYVVDNDSGAEVRRNLNLALEAIVSHNSGTTEPVPSPIDADDPISYAYMLWADTDNTLLKMRNGANSDWIEIGTLDQTGLNIVAHKFPNVTTNVTLTSAQMNDAVYLPSGTKMVFFENAAPVGWTLNTDHNDKALRVVDNTVGNIGGGSGGTTGFSSAHTHSHTGSGGSHMLTQAQMPSHRHVSLRGGNTGSTASGWTTVNSSLGPNGFGGGTDDDDWGSSYTTYIGGNSSNGAQSKGSTSSHSHSVTVVSASISPKYIDVIVCEKD
jgi:hypothetical protein